VKTVYLTEPGRFELRDVPAPELSRPGDVSLRIVAVGVCGSDMHYYRSGRIGSQVLGAPWVMGHECTAVVEEVGSEVRGLTPGQRVAVDPLVSCGGCDQCRSGRVHTCREQSFLGCPGQLPGCMSERIVMPAECCFVVPDAVSTAGAVMAEPFAIALHARNLLLQQTPSLAGLDVGVLGVGPVGLCVQAALQLSGIGSLSVTDELDYRLELSRSLLSDASWDFCAHNPTRQDVVREIERRHPLGLDAIYDCCGEQDALDQAVRLLKPGGTLLLVGIPESSRVSFDINALRRKELTVKNVRRQNDCTPEALELLGSGRARLDGVVTHHFEVEAASEAFQVVAGYRDGVGKALVHFS
jgi:L-iditol 2-dehydrogenase